MELIEKKRSANRDAIGAAIGMVSGLHGVVGAMSRHPDEHKRVELILAANTLWKYVDYVLRLQMSICLDLTDIPQP
jgi:hypothetical protein